MIQIPLPKDVRLHLKSRTLELVYEDGTFELTAEYLRVHSPSAEVRGHGIGQETLQTGKKLVAIRSVQPSGNYALKIVFDDGHDSGLYTWEYLHDLAHNHADYWQRYLTKLAESGGSRDGGLIARS
ncbi:gamma-butyrobetaine hydroxylase-like domain-containing protein [Nitrincola sp.]|uniref:gamma-butyrobetaine hydroxylase-like domain-containing protein n=1 Tax=Nitrincola sp. TaxID=1926584 RepID=UPI003A8E1249